MTESQPTPLITRTKSGPLKRIVMFLILIGVIAAGAWYFGFLPIPDAQDGKDQTASTGHHHGDKSASGSDASGGGKSSGGKSGGKGGKSDADIVIPVSSATIAKGDIDVTRKELGTVTSLASITVRTQVNGQLMEVGFQEGQIVQKGDFLAQIDPRPFETSLQQAQGTLQHDQALLKDAQLNLERYKKLFTQDSIAKQQVDTQAALVDQYAGNVLTDQGQIDSAKLNLTYAHITAPITGRVGLRQVDPGNYAQTSDANGIVTMTQLQPISVVFTLPEDDVPTVMKLYNDGAELTTTAYDRAQTTKLATGKVSATDNQIDTTTGTVKLKAEFDNTDNALFPNQFVNIELKISTLHDVILAPTSAIQRGTPGTFVYKIKDDNTVAVQPVKVGTTQNDKVEITDGLAVGDKVVTEGVDKLRDGAHVAVK